MVCAVVVAAGKSTRMGGGDKSMIPVCGKPILLRCLEAFESCAAVDSICLVTSLERLESYASITAQWGISKLVSVVPGGETRTASVYNGLKALPPDCGIVAIQDGARPFTTPDIIRKTVESARSRGSGVAAIRSRDTVKIAEGGGSVLSTPDRSAVWLVQTPQTFRHSLILNAYERAVESGIETTDDASVAELAGETVWLVEGSSDNIKITTPEDITHAEAIIRSREGNLGMLRIGEGYDVHRLVSGRALVLGGVNIPHEKGLLGHSDADVLVHSVMDALLGAGGLGDIGMHFPDTDDSYRDASSLLLLERVAALLTGKGYRTGNVDATIAAQRPRLAPHIPAMRENIARCLGVPVDSVSVKATTTEGLGFEGREEGISARAVAFLVK